MGKLHKINTNKIKNKKNLSSKLSIREINMFFFILMRDASCKAIWAF